ncbi:hypothetical protein VI06_21490 [Aquitalea magnusonii]|nr:hypothetical protein VI06_21490 [Aquitalea magnusonii]
MSNQCRKLNCQADRENAPHRLGENSCRLVNVRSDLLTEIFEAVDRAICWHVAKARIADKMPFARVHQVVSKWLPELGIPRCAWKTQ